MEQSAKRPVLGRLGSSSKRDYSTSLSLGLATLLGALATVGVASASEFLVCEYLPLAEQEVTGSIQQFPSLPALPQGFQSVPPEAIRNSNPFHQYFLCSEAGTGELGCPDECPGMGQGSSPFRREDRGYTLKLSLSRLLDGDFVRDSRVRRHLMRARAQVLRAEASETGSSTFSCSDDRWRVASLALAQTLPLEDFRTQCSQVGSWRRAWSERCRSTDSENSRLRLQDVAPQSGRAGDRLAVYYARRVACACESIRQLRHVGQDEWAFGPSRDLGGDLPSGEDCSLYRRHSPAL